MIPQSQYNYCFWITINNEENLARIAIIKKSPKNKCWKGCGEKGAVLYFGGNVNRCSYHGRQYRGSLKTDNRVGIWYSNSSPGHISRQNCNLKRYMHSNVHSSIIYKCQDMRQPTRSQTDDWIKVWYIHISHKYTCAHTHANKMQYYSVIKRMKQRHLQQYRRT